MELGYGRAPYARFQPMKVMLLTLQEEPPSADIYKDKSYEFSSGYHSLIKKCLRKDPSKRLSAKKLLEDKFFKQAKDRNYIVEHLVKKLPPPPPIESFQNQRIHICSAKINHDQARVEKNKPVSVGSWEFDKAEFEEFKRKANEQDEDIRANRLKAIDSSYHQQGNSTPNSPDSGTNTPQHSNQPSGDQQQGEHREGRFFVSDDDGNAQQDQQDHQDQQGDGQLPEFHDQVDRQPSTNDGDNNNAEVLHFNQDFNDQEDNQDQQSFHPDEQQEVDGEDAEQVGRFSIMDEEYDSNNNAHNNAQQPNHPGYGCI
jgi:serine/threonine protein kinase